MKALLGILMCLVLVTSQAYAISGGPDYGTAKVRTTGIYAGLFIPTTAGENSLGLFTVTIPKTGLGTGTIGLFRNGIFYPGTIQAIADPDSAAITGVVNSSFNITFTSVTDKDGKTTNTVVTYNANGSLKGKIRPNKEIFSTASSRIRGESDITYKTVGGFPDPDSNSFCPGSTGTHCAIPYRVNGFKQAETQ